MCRHYFNDRRTNFKWVGNSKIVKKNTNVIWGGIHPTILPKQTLENKYIDFIVIGEGEVTFLCLLKTLKNKNKKEFNTIKGIGYKDTSGIHINERQNYLDLDNLPDLPYYLLEMDKYITTSMLGHTPKTIETWVNQFNAKGFAGLQEEPKSGRPPTLNGTIISNINSDLRKSPRNFGYSQNLWDGKLLSYHLEHIYR